MSVALKGLREDLLEYSDKLDGLYERECVLIRDLVGVSNALDLKKIELYREAIDLKTDDGKPKFKNESLRDGYVKENFLNRLEYGKYREVRDELGRVQAKIKGLDIKAKAIRVIFMSMFRGDEV